MVSYSSWNGQKMSGNKHLLTEVLKGELGFKGFLISDWAAIDQLDTNYKKDVELSVNAGLDMFMIPRGGDQTNTYLDFITDLKQLVAEGRVPQARIDDAVRRILTVKYEMGLFEHPFTDHALMAQIGSPKHREVARQCVRESMVLLQNRDHVLPLPKKIKHLCLIGQGADDLGMQCGGWTIDWQGRTGEATPGGTTILAAVRKALGANVEVTYSKDGSDTKGADAIVAVVGEQPYAEFKGDRQDLRLDAGDVALVKKAKATGVPVVTVLLSGRPMILGEVLDASDGLIAAWLPGTEGQGIADVLFGDYKPTGKLSRTWPRNNNQLVADSIPAGETPQFPYGFGLSY
jgi:beta-glucosidase